MSAVFGAGGFRFWFIGDEPVGPRTLAAYRRIVAMRRSGEIFDDRFQARPKIKMFEHGIHEIRDGTIISIFRIGVVQAVMARRLQNAPILEARDETAVFRPGAMGHLMDFVGIDADCDKKRQLPGEQAERPGDAENRGTHQDQLRRTLPPGETRKKAGEVMVHDIGPDDGLTDEGRGFREVSVFGPVDDPRHEIGESDDEDDLERN